MTTVHDGHTETPYTRSRRIVDRPFTTSKTRSFTTLGPGGTACAKTTMNEGDESMGDEQRSGAKERYDAKRPVVSVRVSEAQKKKLEEMSRTSGKSVGQLVREGIGLERRDWREAYRRGLDRGREEARERYAVKVPCVCGHSFTVAGQDRIREVEEILAAHSNWYHKDCRPDEVPGSECRLFKSRPREAGRERGPRPDRRKP